MNEIEAIVRDAAKKLALDIVERAFRSAVKSIGMPAAVEEPMPKRPKTKRVTPKIARKPKKRPPITSEKRDMVMSLLRLGTMTDAAVGRATGTGQAIVSRLRRESGIPAVGVRFDQPGQVRGRRVAVPVEATVHAPPNAAPPVPVAQVTEAA